MSDMGIDQIPVPSGGTGLNQPDKPYGSGVELQSLKDSLPAAPQGPGQGRGGPGVPPPGPSRPLPQFSPPGGAASPVPGVPTPLVAPGTGSPPPPMSNVAAVAQSRITMLDRLVNDPGVSDETKEWATSLLRVIQG